MPEFPYEIIPTPPVPPPSGGGSGSLGISGGSGAFGSGAFGSMNFGSGGGAVVVSAQQLTLNSVLVRFAGDVQIRNRGAVFDALYDRGWRLGAYSDPNAHVPLVYWVERYDESAVVLYLDAPLDGPGITYLAQVSVEISQSSNPADRTVAFRTFGAPKDINTLQQRRSFDVANQQAGEAGPGEQPPLGTFEYDADGDYKNDAGLANYKKRVIRRLTTRLGAFGHLPNYGLDIPLKGQMRPGVLRSVQTQAVSQVLAEPGTITGSVTVTVSSPATGVFLLAVRARCAAGGIGVDVTVGG